MAFLYMGFARQDDLLSQEKSNDITSFRDGMIVASGNETHESEFWPIEHPTEPLDEDRPVKCPMLNSSVLNNGRMPNEQFAENLKKKTEQQSQRAIVPSAEAPTLRTLRKRHHTQTSTEDYTSSSPFLRMPPRDLTIFDMLQQLDKV